MDSDKQKQFPRGSPPTGFDASRFFAGVDWYQNWEVFKGVFTPGRHNVSASCDFLKLPADLGGKRVLDIGAWHGCFSFECERRGASEVIALSLEDPEATGFNRMKQILDSRVTFRQSSVYSLAKEELGEFDIILFLGVLYHLRYPILAMDKIRGVSRGTVYIETHVCDRSVLGNSSLGRVGNILISKLLADTPIWKFYKGKELAGDSSNWFGPNIKAVCDGFESAGFRIECLGRRADRAAFRAVAQKDLEQALNVGYEGQYEANRSFIGIK